MFDKKQSEKIELVTRLGLGRLSSTETQQGAEKISQEPTVFDKRKADHKKKFTQVSLQNSLPINGDRFFLDFVFSTKTPHIKRYISNNIFL